MRHDQLFQYFQTANGLVNSSQRLPEGFPPEEQQEDYFALRFAYAEVLHARLNQGVSTESSVEDTLDHTWRVETLTDNFETRFYFVGFDSGYTTTVVHVEAFPDWLFKRTKLPGHHRSTYEAAWRDGVRVGLAIQQEREAWDRTRAIMFG